MSLFGKILIILNAILAGLFFFLAALDWGKRETWADSYLHHELVITGLPLDDKEPDAKGEPRVDHIREPLLKQMFQKAGGKVVRTQLEELADVKARIQAKIDGQKTVKEKAIQQILVLQAMTENQGDRASLTNEMVQVMKAVETEPETDKLQLRIDNAFKRAEAAGEGSGGKTITENHKQTIADLLFRLTTILRLDEAPEGQPAPDVLASKAYERFLVVSGVEKGATAVDRHAATLRQISKDLRDAIDRERDRFAIDYKKRLEQIAALASQVRDLEDFLTRQKTLQADKESQVAGREKLLEDLKKQLAKDRDKNKEMLAEQKALEEALYKSRQELRDAFFGNQKLEQQLKALEASR